MIKIKKKVNIEQLKTRVHLKRRYPVLFSVLFLLTLTLLGCSTTGNSQSEPNDLTGKQDADNAEKILIYTTAYPVYFFAQEIVGERGEVRSMIPVGAEPHDFEPTARDIINLSQADLFIYNGGGFESWIEKIVDSVNSDQLVWVDTTAHIPLLSNATTGHYHDEEQDHGNEHQGKEEADHSHESAHEHEAHEHETHEHTDHDHGIEDQDHHAHDHDHGDFDPHVWLDPLLAMKQAEEIKEALITFDPEYATYYEAQYERLAQRLTGLDQAFQDLREHVQRTDFIVSHAAYGYLAHRYGFDQISITGLNPSNEPSPRELQGIVEYATEHQVQYILFENMVSAKIAEVVQESVGAVPLVLYNLEVITEEELSQGEDFFTLMERNIEVLKQALGYQKEDE